MIYCENCLAERVAGTTPPAATFQPAPGYPTRTPVATGPNPALAGILGAIPFGVGAIYCGQYVKGLAHLGIFIFLVVAQSSDVPDYLHVILGFAIAFFVIYQIVDAVRTAKALQVGQPAPDPFGLVAAFSPGGKPTTRKDAYKSIPAGALILIGLGVLFLLHNLGFWFIRPGVVWSAVLIGLGMWLFVRRFESGDPDCRRRGIIGPAVLVTLGVQSLLDALDVVSFGRTLPALLIVIGVVILVQRSSGSEHYPSSPPPSGMQATPESTNEATPSTEVKNG